MTTRAPSILVAVLLAFSLAVPGSLVVQPQKAEAVTIVQDLIDFVYDTLSYVSEALIEVSTLVQEELQYLFYVKEYILEPLAFIQSGKAVQGLTGGMLGFVSGQSNGTGQSQFITNIPGHLQGVGTNSMESFIRQLRLRSNSPYAGVVSNSLRNRYLESSTLDGFFESRKSTLPEFSSDPTAFIQGDWSKGGMSAWFALTSRRENNPYSVYFDTESMLSKVSSQAQETHEQMLDWGQGFLSWCGEDPDFDPNTPTDADADGVSANSPCTRPDGTPGIIQTPGTTITNYLDKSLELDADKLTQMGNASTQITELIGSLMDTALLAQTVIGGPQGGLAGVGRAADGGSSLLDTYNNPDTPYAGASQCSINHTIAENSPSNGDQVLDRVEEYLESVEAIGSAALSTQTVLTELQAACRASEQTVQARIDSGNSSQSLAQYVGRMQQIIGQAQAALDEFVVPAIDTAAVAVEETASSTTFILKLQGDLESEGVGDPPVCADYSEQISLLERITPTRDDAVAASADAISSGFASTSPSTSWEGRQTVSLDLILTNRSSAVDEFALLRENAEILEQECSTLPF